jgi:hypothetical protein
MGEGEKIVGGEGMTIEERAYKLALDVLDAEAITPRFYVKCEQVILEALQAQDAETEKRTRHACAEAASITVRQTRLVAGEYVSCEVADALARHVHAACMNAEVKNEASRS